MKIQVEKDHEVSSLPSSCSRIGCGVGCGCAVLYQNAIRDFSAQEGQVNTVKGGCGVR